jgi:hypothetical protein
LEHDDGPEDEGLRRDFSWSFTPIIVEWKRGDFDNELVEISHAQASKIIDYSPGVLADDAAWPTQGHGAIRNHQRSAVATRVAQDSRNAKSPRARSPAPLIVPARLSTIIDDLPMAEPVTTPSSGS